MRLTRILTVSLAIGALSALSPVQARRPNPQDKKEGKKASDRREGLQGRARTHSRAQGGIRSLERRTPGGTGKEVEIRAIAERLKAAAN